MATVRQTLPTGLIITPASTEDIPIITSITHAAYQKYIPRIGKPPAPMTTHWPTVLQTHQVSVLKRPIPETHHTQVVGAIVLGITQDPSSIKINNLVVDEKAQGKGYGKILMRFAEDEARERGRGALELFTNVLMWENLTLYPKMGFVETERRGEDGFERVFYRKDL